MSTIILAARFKSWLQPEPKKRAADLSLPADGEPEDGLRRTEDAMDARLLSRFVTVAELGSFNKAVAQLNISQPALSTSMRLLDDHFSVELLRRRPRGVNLTAYGQTLVLHAKVVAAELGKLDREISMLRNVSIDEVSVGVPPGPGFISHVPTDDTTGTEARSLELTGAPFAASTSGKCAKTFSATGYSPLPRDRPEFDQIVVALRNFFRGHEPHIISEAEMAEPRRRIGPSRSRHPKSQRGFWGLLGTPNRAYIRLKSAAVSGGYLGNAG
jgi:hypothetical protein